MELSSEVEGLLSEIEELHATNDKLKAEFIAFEEKRSGVEIDQRDRRKLVVLKQLFIEAASLLQDVEDDLDVKDEDNQPNEMSDDQDQGELLEYEEVNAQEAHVSEAGVSHKNKEPEIVPASEPGDSAASAPIVGKKQQAKKKTSKKWLFGNGKKNLDHKSLYELEAQARHELQRLSSQGGDISALFDKNK